MLLLLLLLAPPVPNDGGSSLLLALTLALGLVLHLYTSNKEMRSDMAGTHTVVRIGKLTLGIISPFDLTPWVCASRVDRGNARVHMQQQGRQDDVCLALWLGA